MSDNFLLNILSRIDAAVEVNSTDGCVPWVSASFSRLCPSGTEIQGIYAQHYLIGLHFPSFLSHMSDLMTKLRIMNLLWRRMSYRARVVLTAPSDA